MIRIKNPFPPRLPSEYQEVEYIESTGTQYIDTGFQPNNNTRVVMDFEITEELSGTYCLFGARVGPNTQNYSMLYINSNFRSDYNNSYEQTWALSSIGRRTIDKNKETTIIDNVSKSYENVAFQTPHNLFLLANNNVGAVRWQIPAKLYSCQIYNNDVLVRSFIPCYRTSDNVAGLYDLVNKVFYENAGTGTFLIGAEVNKRDVNIEPIIGENDLLARYIEDKLVYKSGPSYKDTEFASSPFPTSWVKGTDNNNYSATNEYGEWKITSSSYASSSNTVNTAFDRNENSCWVCNTLSSDTAQFIVEISCPVLIKPNKIYHKTGYHGNASNTSYYSKIQGYNPETNSWETFATFNNSVSSSVSTTTVTKENFYSKFRIIGYRYSSTYKQPRVYELQITSGTIRQEV